MAGTQTDSDVTGSGAGRESCTLAALRDALLPKLSSGELRVREAPKLVELVA